MESLRETSHKMMTINSPQGEDEEDPGRIEVSDVAGVRTQLVRGDSKDKDPPRRLDTCRHNLKTITDMPTNLIEVSLLEQESKVLLCIPLTEVPNTSENKGKREERPKRIKLELVHTSGLNLIKDW